MMQKPIADEICPPNPAPLEWAGQWVAWDIITGRIVARASSVAEAMDAADESGYPDAVLERVPRPGIAFIGFA